MSIFTTGYITAESMTVPKFMRPTVSIKLADPKAMPARAHPTDAGADLFSSDVVHIYPTEMKMVDTGVAIRIPVGYVGLIFNRSSQGKLGVQIANGTGIIDSDYRGNLKVLLKNTGDDPYFIYPYSTRIAQLVIVPIMLADFSTWVGSDAEWLNTARGEGGFGSTG